ncbi:hypothetical protein [Methylobacterium nodulans]|uniref:Uncharacterized protein n=1 Tax=Methylobacterium nodulans (strain LMG 21967 / CNCM I-2342 / ORS 2060) TaxID=460265 RepID=B8IAN5_METNO|nr:hypothetical protein [Methylobacterium nodulans]ACL61080.1 conserved hypothetical protein [Methylobacterium nodulans ORS 2060]
MATRMREDSAGTITSKEVLQTLFSRADSHKAEMDNARGDFGAFIKDAEATHGIHRKAFKLALSCRRMEAEQLTAFLRAFDLYRDVLNFDAQLDMFATKPAELPDQPAEDAGAAQAAANAEAIQSGIKRTTRKSEKTLN